MPRLVKKSAHEPIIVGDKALCMCGLSSNQPFCNGSHVQTVGEDDKKLYWYENGKREEVSEEEGDCCGGCCGEEGKESEGCCGGGCCQEEKPEPKKK